MSQTLGMTSLLALALLAAAPAGAAPPPSGVYRGELGAARLSLGDGATVRAVTESAGGPCGLGRGETLLEGAVEGSAIVGRLRVCQTGPAAQCGGKTLPVMALWDAAEGTLTGHLRPDPGCGIGGLKGTHFSWRLVSEDAPAAASAQPATSAPSSSGSGSASSAALVAARRVSKQEAEAAGRAFAQGARFAAQGQHKRAVEQYERGLQLHDSHPVAWARLAASRLKAGNVQGSVEAYERAIRFSAKPDPQLHFGLATAWARLKERERALEQVRLAVEHGFPNALGLRKDPELNALLGADPEFNALLNRASERPLRRSN